MPAATPEAPAPGVRALEHEHRRPRLAARHAHARPIDARADHDGVVSV